MNHSRKMLTCRENFFILIYFYLYMCITIYIQFFSMSVLKFCIFGHERVESDMCFDKKHEDFFSQVRIDEKW